MSAGIEDTGVIRSGIIGITGGIGTGKSCVSRLLSGYCNAPLIDIDQCCRQLLFKGKAGWKALYDTFGPELFDQHGELDRPALREIIFSDEQTRAKVDALLHPLAREEMCRQVEALDAPIVFVEIPLLYEAGWQGDVDKALLVYAELEIQCERIMARDNVHREAAVAAISSQMDMKKKMLLADYVIDNSRHWCQIRDQVISVAVRIEKDTLGTTFSQK